MLKGYFSQSIPRHDAIAAVACILIWGGFVIVVAALQWTPPPAVMPMSYGLSWLVICPLVRWLLKPKTAA